MLNRHSPRDLKTCCYRWRPPRSPPTKERWKAATSCGHWKQENASRTSWWDRVVVNLNRQKPLHKLGLPTVLEPDLCPMNQPARYEAWWLHLGSTNVNDTTHAQHFARWACAVSSFSSPLTKMSRLFRPWATANFCMSSSNGYVTVATSFCQVCQFDRAIAFDMKFRFQPRFMSLRWLYQVLENTGKCWLMPWCGRERL